MKRSWRLPHAETLLAADRLLDEAMVWEPEDLDLHAIAARLGAVIVPEPMTKGRGFVSRSHEGAIISVCEKVLRTCSAGFTIAHEIGHVVRHPDVGLLAFCEEGGRFWQREGDANDFAARITLSPRLLDAKRGSFVESTLATAARHRVSPSAAAQALLDHRDAPAALAVVTDDVIKWWAASDAFPFKLTKNFELTRRSLPHHFTKDKKARAAKVTVADLPLAWPEEGTLHLFEQA
jgi:Zn-dependent peptidase ImmA (M78 family)